MWRFILLGVAIIAVGAFGISLIDVRGDDDISARAVFAGSSDDIAGFARALEPREWRFPTDFGPHPEFQTEWWYYTGNLADENGRRFGYQFTIFRRSATPQGIESDSEWRSNQIYMGHFTVTDVERGDFYEQQRFSRGSAGLAGAVVEPGFRVWLEDWEVKSPADDFARATLTASGGDVAVDLVLEQSKPVSLQGDNGLNARGRQPGEASYYYSISRLLTEGTVTIRGEVYHVTGATWMDHEFNTQALDREAQGWDWFGLHLDDGRDLVVGQLRLDNQRVAREYSGMLIEADGAARVLPFETFTIAPTAFWESPNTGGVYPAGWDIRVALSEGEMLDLTLTPMVDDQELHRGNIVYWEGAIRIGGDVTGYGYAELTGYVDAIGGRF